MANSEAGWTSEWPPSGWYFMRRSGEEVTIDGTIVWVGHNKSGLRWEGQFFYSDHAFCQNREFLGPLTISNAEQLIELRKTHDSVLRDLKQAAFAYHVEANHKPSAFADCRNGICANACRVFNAHVELNPKHPEKETQSK